jgi:metal-dependent HD superfamily phosphatase/phosphodiesterase
VAVGGLLSFTKSIASKNQDFTSNSVTFEEPGLYLVTVSASGAVSGTTAGIIGIQLQQNGQNMAGYASTTYSTGATDVESVTVQALVRVEPTTCPLDDRSVTVSVANTNSAAIYSNVTLTTLRLPL